MEIVKCASHGRPCLLKTGVKEGYSYGRSFYICSYQADRCQFVAEAPDIEMLDCPDHPGYKVELQAMFTRDNECKQMYRCKLSRSENKNWCGVWIKKSQSAQRAPTMPLKVRDGNTSTSVKDHVVSKPHDPGQLEKHGDRKSVDKPHKNDHAPAGKLHTSERKSSDSIRDESKLVEKAHKNEKISLVPEKQPETASSGVVKSKPNKLKSVSDEHNLTFEGLASKHATRLMSLDDENMSLNESARSYRDNSVMDEASDSDEDDSRVSIEEQDSEQGDRVQPYRDTSVVDISSDDDSEDERPNNDTHATKDSDNAVTVNGAESDKLSRLLSGLKAKDSTQVITTQRADGTKVIKIVGKSNKNTMSGEVTSTANHSSAAGQPTIVTNKQEAARPASANQGVSNEVKPIPIVMNAAGAGNDLMRHVRRKNDLLKILSHQQDIMKKVNLSILPDKGARIQQQVDQCTRDIAELDLKINKEKDIIARCHQESSTSGARPKVVVLQPNQEQRTVSGQVLPSNMKQTRITDHAMMSKLPAHVFQQMYAANPQMNTLYGGRMTAARLQEVGSVTSEAIERLHKQLETMPESEDAAEDPEGLLIPLMQHQRQALKWLQWREEQHPTGGILADDMGLGKTLTMISHIIQQRELRHGRGKVDKKQDKWFEKGGKGLLKSNATLIVCPASVVHQWDREISRRCEKNLLSVVLYHGPNREKDLNVLADADIVLTTYNLISREVGVPDDLKKKKVPTATLR